MKEGRRMKGGGKGKIEEREKEREVPDHPYIQQYLHTIHSSL